MKRESVEEFLARGGQIKKEAAPEYEPSRRHYTNKDKIDVVTGVKRKTGASKMFDSFAKGFLGKGNTSWKYGK